MAAGEDLDADLGWVRDPSVVMWCVTCVRQMPAAELLSAVGATAEPDLRWTAGEAQGEAYRAGGVGVRVAPGEGWSVLIELQSLKGGDGAWLQEISRGREALSYFHSGSGMEMFRYAVDGAVVAEFEPAIPARRSGTDPDRLVPAMRAAGVDPPPETGDADLGVAALRLVERVTGVRVTGAMVLAGQWPAGVIPRRRRA